MNSRRHTQRSPEISRSDNQVSHRPALAEIMVQDLRANLRRREMVMFRPRRGGKARIGGDIGITDCGRDAHYCAPPAQNRTCGFPAYGSHLGCLTAKRAACRTRSSAWVARARICVRCVLCWSAFPSAPALRSTGSSAGCPASFVGFLATMAGSDFSRPFIAG